MCGGAMTRRIIVPTTARARVDVTSDARNASRAGSRVRASPARPLSVSETNARGAAVDPKASLPVASHDRRRQDLCRNVRRVRVGRRHRTGCWDFSRFGAVEDRPNPGKSTILFLSSRGWVFVANLRVLRCALFPIPFSFSFYPPCWVEQPDWFAWAHKLRYLFIPRLCGSAVTVDRGIQS